MKCAHCLESFHPEFIQINLRQSSEGYWAIFHQICPACKKTIFLLDCSRVDYNFPQKIFSRLVYPKSISRNPLPLEVDDSIVVSDYSEAALILVDSPKASAALSRRCLQHILREKAGVKHSDLSKEIQEVLNSEKLPTEISENLDAVRNIGNFAAHPLKSTSTGEIMDVEPEEAEWNLEVLDQLIDFYYVRPLVAKKKRDDLNKKLVTAGKPPLKTISEI